MDGKAAFYATIFCAGTTAILGAITYWSSLLVSGHWRLAAGIAVTVIFAGVWCVAYNEFKRENRLSEYRQLCAYRRLMKNSAELDR